VAGAADILCLKPNKNYNYLCLEAKTEYGSQSDEQIEFQNQVEDAGGKYSIFRSVDEGLTILSNYLKDIDG